MHPIRVIAPSPIDTGPRGPSRTTGVTVLSHAAPCWACRVARSARVITPVSVLGRMTAVSEPLELQRLADLTDDELAAAYTPQREPWLRVNFVSTVDGAAAGSDGLSGTINNDADKRVFDTLRRRAHCLVVGAGTIREEEYDVPRDRKSTRLNSSH